MTVGIELVRIDLAAQCIAMDAEKFSRLRLIPVGAVQHALDEALLKFADGFIKQNPALYHLIDEPFQLIFHDGTLR